jgi:hypothetical protein
MELFRYLIIYIVPCKENSVMLVVIVNENYDYSFACIGFKILILLFHHRLWHILATHPAALWLCRNSSI